MQVTLSIELNASQVDEFQRMIPVQLALPPWNYTDALDKGITVISPAHHFSSILFDTLFNSLMHKVAKMVAIRLTGLIHGFFILTSGRSGAQAPYVTILATLCIRGLNARFTEAVGPP